MIDRGWIQLSGPDPKFRISRRGADISSTDPFDFLIHENELIAQPIFSDFIECPFASQVNVYAHRVETVSVTIPDVTSNPIPILYPQWADGQHVYPGTFSVGVIGGRSESAYDFYVNVVSSTQIDVTFGRRQYSRTSPAGAVLTVYRSAS